MFKVVSLKGVETYFASDDQRKVTVWLDGILRDVAGYSLMSQLNEMQAQGCEWPQEDYGVFENKYLVPLYFVNLLIKDFGLKIIKV